MNIEEAKKRLVELQIDQKSEYNSTGNPCYLDDIESIEILLSELDNKDKEIEKLKEYKFMYEDLCK
jgi:hypothetical protein